MAPENAKKRQLEDGADSKGSEKFSRKEETKERTFRQPRIETPSYTGGVSDEAYERCKTWSADQTKESITTAGAKTNSAMTN